VIHPLRTAPYHHHLGILLDLATGRILTTPAVQHLIVITSGILAGLSAYGCLRRLAPDQAREAWLLALLYVSSPAFLGFAYTLEMFMTVTAVPWVPVVLFANLQLNRGEGWPAWALLAGALTAVWTCHAPVGLWLTIITGGIQGWRLLQSGLEAWRRAFLGLLLFLGLSAGYFWSVLEIVGSPAATVGRRELAGTILVLGAFAGAARYFATRRIAWAAGGIVSAALALAIHPPAAEPPALGALRGLWPANLAPVSVTAGASGDVQPGVALLLAGLAGAVLLLRAKPPGAGVFVAALVACAALFFPIPGLSRLLLSLVPDLVVSLSSVSLWQRTLPILAALLALVAMDGLAAWSKRSRQSAGLVLGALVLAVAWNLGEARKFSRAGRQSIASTGEHFDFGRPDNIRQFAYVFPSLPFSTYLVNGVADYHLESRLLDPTDPTGTAADPFRWEDRPVRRLTAVPEPDNPNIYRLTPGFTLGPGERKAVRFSFGTGPYAGTLILRGEKGWYREYQLPEAGFGPRSFGVAADRPKMITLWNAGLEPQKIGLQFVGAADKPGVRPPRDFAEVAEQTYDVAALPVRTDTLVPYRASTVVDQAAWLETPRTFVPGYWASVNGRAVTVTESPNHRVSVRLEPGANRVVLTYPGTTALWFMVAVSAVCWTGLAGVAWRHRLRFRRQGAAGNASERPADFSETLP
jgi:hypothetical protein